MHGHSLVPPIAAAEAVPYKYSHRCLFDEVAVEIIDLIYEAPFVPGLWPKLLSELAQVSGSIGSSIFLFGEGGSGRGVTLDNLKDLLDEFLGNADLRFSTSVVRMCDTKPNSFVEVDDYLSAAEIENDPIRIRLRARGIGAHVCTAIAMPTGEIAIYVLQRAFGEPGYDPETIRRLNELRPHLARAALIASRLGLEKARGTVAALESLGIAAAVCANGRAIASNDLFLSHPHLFRVGAQDRVTMTGSEANDLLQASMLEGNMGGLAAGRSIPVSNSTAGPGVLHVLPLRRSAREMFPGGDSVAVFTAVKASELVPVPSVLSGLFDLTPAEAKLAVNLAAGHALKSAAELSEIKLSTARSHLVGIFRKTGTKQQSQLVALLKSASAIR
jgi:DNA-binding CsgD family transcriptional regulator